MNASKQKTFSQLLDGYKKEAATLYERKRLLPTGEKSTNVEVQIDRTLAVYERTIKRLSQFQKG